MTRLIVLKWLVVMTSISSVNAEDKSEGSPSLEFLEYLGTMVEQGDELVGPGDMENYSRSDTDPFPDSIVIESPGKADEEEIYRD